MPIRIIGGSSGGRRLIGAPRTGLRPTTDRVRESMFAMLEAADTDFSNVLDLYSGTGALGIEALSRGDGRCDFVESDSKTAEVIRQNLMRTVLWDRAKVYALQVAKALPRLKGPYTLVVADPPYEYDRAESELDQPSSSTACWRTTASWWWSTPSATNGRRRWQRYDGSTCASTATRGSRSTDK